MTKQQVIRALSRRFPDANRKQLARFVESDWDGDIDADAFEVMAETWAQGLDADEGPAVY